VAAREADLGSTVAVARLQKLRQLLNETIETKDLQQPLTLKEALGLIQEKVNEKYKEVDALPILVDDEAFKEANPDAPDIYDTQVKCPPYPRHMSVVTALRVALSKVPTRNATFLLRGGFVEVTTTQEASLNRLLRRKVLVSFERHPLTQVVEALSALTGVSVVLDGRAAEKLKTPITLSLTNDVTLEAALRLVADMADLKLVVLHDVAYITTPANAHVLRKEQREAAEEARRNPAREQTPPAGKESPRTTGKKD